MIHSITLENFLAHKLTEIPLGPGMTVLSGPNNSGKSAVVEGLRCVAQNPSPRHFIRHGAKEARVTVEVDDGTKITWVRKKATVVYEVLRPGEEEPEVFRKLRKGQVPEEVLDLLRLDPVELESGKKKGDKRVDVHIGNQRQPIFLLDEDGADARMAEFFVASTEGAHLISMQKLLQARIRENKTTAKTVERRMRDLAVDLDKLAPLPDIERGLTAAAELESALAFREQAATKLEQAARELARLDAARTGLAARSNALSPLAGPPPVHDAETLAELARSMRAVTSEQARGRATLTALAGLAEPPQPKSTTMLADMIDEHNNLSSKIKRLDTRQVSMADLQEPPMLREQESLAGLLRDMQTLGQRLERLSSVHEAQSSAMVRHEEEMQRRIEEIGSCPLCGNLLAPESLLGKEDLLGEDA